MTRAFGVQPDDHLAGSKVLSLERNPAPQAVDTYRLIDDADRVQSLPQDLLVAFAVQDGSRNAKVRHGWTPAALTDLSCWTRHGRTHKRYVLARWYSFGQAKSSQPMVRIAEAWIVSWHSSERKGQAWSEADDQQIRSSVGQITDRRREHRWRRSSCSQPHVNFNWSGSLAEAPHSLHANALFRALCPTNQSASALSEHPNLKYGSMPRHRCDVEWSLTDGMAVKLQHILDARSCPHTKHADPTHTHGRRCMDRSSCRISKE